ncbi:MAG: chaperonin GroES [Rickettsiales bacterium]|jgi:chaperonin GroES
MAIKTLHDNILVERIEAETKTKGGIIIPDTAQEKPSEGVIIAVGEGAYDNNGKRIPLDVKIGDKILFKKWGSTEVKLDDKELVIMKESDVLAIIS